MDTIMKTLTLHKLCLPIACLFAASVALCDTLNSSLQYGTELETKHNTLSAIKEDPTAVEDALKKKLEEARKNAQQGEARLNRLDFVGHDIAALIPSAPQPIFDMHVSPCGTLTPQGNAGVVKRGFEKKEGMTE